MLFGDGTENREADGMIAADAHATHTCLEKRSDSLLDAEKRVLDGKRIHGEIAKIGDAMFGKWIDMQHRVPRTDDRGLDANITRAEARAGAIGCAAVERNADDGDIEFGGLGKVRQAHKGGDAREAGETESVEGLGMGQAKGAARLRGNVGHGEAS